MNDNKLDIIVRDIGEIKADLREHMLRTEQNEHMIERLDQQVSPLFKTYIGLKWAIGAGIAIGSLVAAFLKS